MLSEASVHLFTGGGYALPEVGGGGGTSCPGPAGGRGYRDQVTLSWLGLVRGEGRGRYPDQVTLLSIPSS